MACSGTALLFCFSFWQVWYLALCICGFKFVHTLNRWHKNMVCTAFVIVISASVWRSEQSKILEFHLARPEDHLG
jgi:purine-cytosine permease-like protein